MHQLQEGEGVVKRAVSFYIPGCPSFLFSSFPFSSFPLKRCAFTVEVTCGDIRVRRAWLLVKVLLGNAAIWCSRDTCADASALEGRHTQLFTTTTPIIVIIIIVLFYRGGFTGALLSRRWCARLAWLPGCCCCCCCSFSVAFSRPSLTSSLSFVKSHMHKKKKEENRKRNGKDVRG